VLITNYIRFQVIEIASHQMKLFSMANAFPSVPEKGANIVRSTWDSMTMKITKEFVTVSNWQEKKRNQKYGQYIRMRLASVISKILRWHGSLTKVVRAK
jgi:hypothetical protein